MSYQQITIDHPAISLYSINNLLIARHPYGTQRGLLPLLPSGPDGVCNLLLRRTRLSTRFLILYLLIDPMWLRVSTNFGASYSMKIYPSQSWNNAPFVSHLPYSYNLNKRSIPRAFVILLMSLPPYYVLAFYSQDSLCNRCRIFHRADFSTHKHNTYQSMIWRPKPWKV